MVTSPPEAIEIASASPTEPIVPPLAIVILFATFRVEPLNVKLALWWR